MTLVDLFLPDDMPLQADADLGRSLAALVDASGEVGAPASVVYVHRLPVFAVVTAAVEGVRVVRVHVTPLVPADPGLAVLLEDAVRCYLRTVRGADGHVIVSVAPARSDATVR